MSDELLTRLRSALPGRYTTERELGRGGDGILPYAKRYPFFALLQRDPRMERIYRRVGLLE